MRFALQMCAPAPGQLERVEFDGRRIARFEPAHQLAYRGKFD